MPVYALIKSVSIDVLDGSEPGYDSRFRSRASLPPRPRLVLRVRLVMKASVASA